MMRLLVMVFALFIASIQPSLAAGEIGYVEDFSGGAGRYRIVHDGNPVAMRLLLPLYNGDTIEALDDNARVTLRLNDHSEPVMWSRADRDTKLSTLVPEKGFWSGLINWTMVSLSPFDDEKRERVLTNIRGDSAEFGVPLLQAPQTVAAGQRVLVLGWLKPSAPTEISITGKAGRALVSKSKGTGGLWVSPSLNLKPGKYRISVTGPSDIFGDLNVVASSGLPPFPVELTQDSIPEPLRHTVQALWLAAQDGGKYRLEALQLVAGDRSIRPAAVLTEALIAGKTIAPPP